MVPHFFFYLAPANTKICRLFVQCATQLIQDPDHNKKCYHVHTRNMWECPAELSVESDLSYEYIISANVRLNGLNGRLNG